MFATGKVRQMSVTVRELRPDDHAVWGALWKGYCDFYHVAVPDAVTENTWAWLAGGAGPVWGLGAELDGRLAGFVTWQLHPVTWFAGVRCYLEDLYVAEDARGRGLGRALIEAVYAAADRVGADNVYWFTNGDNAPARALYDRVGVYKGVVKYERK